MGCLGLLRLGVLGPAGPPGPLSKTALSILISFTTFLLHKTICLIHTYLRVCMKFFVCFYWGIYTNTSMISRTLWNDHRI